MVGSASPDLPHKNSLQIKQDDKFFSRLLSKEISSNVSSSPSFRVYYGGVPGSVPFLWESQPGTPKHPSLDSSLPPLTPPPSYFSSNFSNQPSKKHPRSKLLNTLLLKINLKKSPMPSSPSFSSVSSWSSSRSSVVSFATTPSKGRSRFSSERSSFDEEEEDSIGSPTSTLCFGVRRDTSTVGIRSVSCRSVVVMKKALMAMVGRGSA